MAKPTKIPNVPRERLHEIAAILAEGYLRLLQNQGSGTAEAGESGAKYAQETPPERLDSSDHQRDHVGTG